MNWGKGIIISFVVFAAFIITLVTVCMQQDVDLVAQNYYQQELIYEQQIKRLQNTEALKEKPQLVIHQNGLQIRFDRLSEIEEGELVLFCPSDPTHDRKILIAASNSQEQWIKVSDFKSGMYRARFSWSMSGKEFYIEKMISL